MIVDLGTVVGDAMVTVEGLDTPVGPGSSVVGVAVVNEIKVRTAERLVARGAMPPVLTSATVVGDEQSGRLFDAAYDEHARRLIRVLRHADRPPRTGPAERPGHERGESA